MKLLSLAVPALLLFACTAGTGTTLGTGTADPAPTTGDQPPSSDHPPSSTDPSGAGCLTCAGSFVCGKGTDKVEVDLKDVNGICEIVTPSSGQPILYVFDPCTGLGSDSITVTRSSDGIQICTVETTVINDFDGGSRTTTRTVCGDCPAGTYTPPQQPPPRQGADAG